MNEIFLIILILELQLFIYYILTNISRIFKVLIILNRDNNLNNLHIFCFMKVRNFHHSVKRLVD